MRKTYKMLLAMVLCALGAVSASAVTADLDPAMFKAWDSPLPGAKVVAEPEAIDDGNATFGCDYKLYEEVGAGTSVFGNTNVYYLWYADLTGTKTMTIHGTAGMQFRILMNRPEPVEGGDPHGGQTVELNCTLDANGEAVVDLSSYEYIHLNCIKTGWGSPAGTIRKIEIEGSVKPVTGWVDMVDNGDMEGDEVKNFIVALDAVKDQGTYPAKILDGIGVNDSRAIMVESMDAPTESWQTQFFIKLNEYLPEGTQWRISMDIKADHEAECGSGCHAEPRSYITGSLFEANPKFTTNWESFEASGTITAAQAGSNGLGSVAFDLNVDGSANKYYFDNVHFEIYKESSPISLIKAGFEYDVICVDFGKATNLPALIKAAGGERVVYPNESVKVTVNGEASTILSVEGRTDGKLYIFLDEGIAENETDLVAVSFTNPEDADKRIIFAGGKYEGEAVPDFSNILATYQEELGNNYSYLLSTPVIETADPEDGSFKLSQDMNKFTIVFNQAVVCEKLTATLDKEKLTVAPAEGRYKEITLTRTGSGALEAGVHTLRIQNVMSREDQIDEAGDYTLTYSFGNVEVDPNDQPKDIVPIAYFNNTENNGIPEGYIVKFGEEIRTSDATYGSGSRMFSFGEGGDFVKGLYYREGYVEYGSVENYALTLEADKKYEISFNTARWKSSGQWTKFEILNENEEVAYEETIENNPDTNGDTGKAVANSTSKTISFIPEVAGNYILRWTAVDGSGNGGFLENLLANVQVKYMPNTLGVAETALLTAALENAKSTLDGNSDDRYSGAAFDALKAVIEKTEGEMAKYTAPSSYTSAAAALDEAAKAVKDHRTLCDTYDPLPQEAQDIIDANAEKKFARTEIFANLQKAVAKYGEKQTVKKEDPDTGEQYDVEVIIIKQLKDDAELQAAVEELKGNIDLAKAMFTEGPSKVGSWESTCTGIAVLVDRIRQGAEGLKELGVAEDDALINEANNALTDDDALAESIKNRIKSEYYGQTKDGKNLFEASIDEASGEEVGKAYNLTVFVKNPNIYKTKASNTFSEENVPGWTAVDPRGLTNGWSDVGTDQIPSDAMFSNWGGNFTVYQTITDLPAGVYTLKAGYGERYSESEDPDGTCIDGSYFYAKTSANVEDSLTVIPTHIGQAFPFTNLSIENVVVVDGQLTLGVQAGAQSHVFFNDVQVLLTGAATDFDYAKAYEDVLAGIDETVARPEKVRAIAIYDLNGRRVQSAKKGIVIVKKLMNDGTIRTEKVVVK